MRRTGFSKHIETSAVTFAMTSGCHSTKALSEYHLDAARQTINSGAVYVEETIR